MSPEEKFELVKLLEERTLSSFQRRKRRLMEIPLEGLAEAIHRNRLGLPCSRQQFIATHLGFTPEEWPKAVAQLKEMRAQ